MAVVSMKQLLEAGVHFGHQTRRWNPKMAKYIFTERNGIYIIDLQKTVKLLGVAYDFLKKKKLQMMPLYCLLELRSRHRTRLKRKLSELVLSMLIIDG